MKNATVLGGWLLVVAIVPAHSAHADDVCEPPQQQRDAALPVFADDVGFDIQVRQSPAGSIVRVTGDTIVIDQDHLASLVAPAGSAMTKLSRLTFDARVIRVRGPLSLQGGHLALLGETISFEAGGEISLLPDRQPRSLRIVAQTLEFNGGPARPFAVDLESAADVQVSIQAVQAPHAKDLWQRFVDAYAVDQPPSSIALVTGDAAQPLVHQAFSKDMEWPLYFAAKLRTHFERSPYADVTRDEIGRLAASYQPLLSSWRGAIPVATARAIGIAAREKTDINGRLRSFTPKQDLISQKKALEVDIKDNSLDTLIELITDNSPDGTDKAGQRTEIQKELEGARQHVMRKQREVASQATKLAALEQRSQGLLERIEQRKEVLRLMSERDVKRMRDAQSARQWTTIGAGAVVIAASMGAATPAVAAGAAAGLGLTGDLVYGHNADQPMTLAGVIEKGQEAYKRVQSFQAALTKVGEAEGTRKKVAKGEAIPKGPKPESGPDKRKPYTKTEATFELLGALGDLAQSAGELNGKELAVPTRLSLSQREDEDEDMKGLLTSFSEIASEKSKEAELAKAAANELLLVTTKVVQLEEMDEQLRAVEAKNDQEAARWRAAGLLLWTREIERISEQLAVYRRSLYFESGRTPRGVPEVLDYPNALQARISAGILDSLGGVGPAAAPEALRAQLKMEKTKFVAAANELYIAIGEAYEDYLQTRNEADVYRQVVDFSADSTDPIKRAFIEALNGQITQQIVGRSPIATMFPLYVPIQLKLPVAELPERLVTARIVDVEFNVPKAAIGNGGLSFVLIHPNYGEMRRGSECFPADFRVKPTDWKFFTTSIEQLDAKWAARQPTSIQIDKDHSNRYYTYLPARTRYHIVINVISTNWRSIPKIKKVSIGLELMQ